MGAGVVGVGGRAARWLRLLLLLVMALAAVEYLCGSILDASPLRTYLYTPLYNATQPTFKSREQSSSSWPKRLPVSLAQPTINPEVSTVLSKNNTIQVLEQKSGNITNITESISTTKPNIITKIMNALKTTTENEQNSSALPLCDEMPPNLGPIPVNKTEIELVDVEHKYPEVQKGGQYAPPNCTARHKVAIIVPYRDRQQHLAIFLNHMHPFLMKQQIEYGIFIVEQAGNMNFNRAKLFNVGFVESQKQHSGGWQCFIFHDVDLLPMDERNMYSCPRQPRHMSAAVDKFQFKLLYPGLFGGVSALTREQFTKVNGFSNNYWGWGAEDDDMAYRLSKNNYHIARYKMSIARYAMLHHKPQTANPKRFKLLSQGGKNFKNDGLNSLRYELMEVVKHHLYTLITVNVDERS